MLLGLIRAPVDLQFLASVGCCEVACVYWGGVDCVIVRINISGVGKDLSPETAEELFDISLVFGGCSIIELHKRNSSHLCMSGKASVELFGFFSSKQVGL